MIAPPGAGPQAREGENVFGVAHIFASFNDTFVVSHNFGYLSNRVDVDLRPNFLICSSLLICPEKKQFAASLVG